MTKRQKINSIIYKVLMGISTIFTFSLLIGIILYVASKGIPHIKAKLFEWNFTSDNQSMLPSILNTLEMIALTLLFSVPIGVFSAIYMVEYAKPGNRFIKYVRLATETLQGIPSIVFGLFGYIFFNELLKLNYSILAGAFTMAIMVLPLIIRSTEEALISVDNKYREASYGLGARKLRTVFNVVLPPAMNGIFSGIILAIGRVFGETAALIYTSGTMQVLAGPKNSGATLAIHLFKQNSEARYPNETFVTAFVLLVVVVLINTLSTLIGNRIGGKTDGRE